MPFRQLLMHLFEQAYGGVIDRTDSPHIHQNKTLGPEVRFQLGEELIRGPEKQIALQLTNHALIPDTAENRALSLTALRLRRYFIEIAFAPDDSHPRTSGIAGRTRRRGGGVASRGAGAAAGEDPAHRHYRRLAPLERLPSRVARSAVATSTIRREGLGEDMVSLIQDP